jgi:hypothetical protein
MAPIGLSLYRLTFVVHDCAHGKLFRSMVVNRLVGGWTAAAVGFDFDRYGRCVGSITVATDAGTIHRASGGRTCIATRSRSAPSDTSSRLCANTAARAGQGRPHAHRRGRLRSLVPRTPGRGRSQPICRGAVLVEPQAWPRVAACRISRNRSSSTRGSPRDPHLRPAVDSSLAGRAGQYLAPRAQSAAAVALERAT